MIEKALYEDLEEILMLQKIAYQSEAIIYDDYELPPLTQTIEGMHADYINQTILQEVTGTTIIGSIRAYEKEGVCYIGRIFVHPEHQNKGIGKMLIKTMEDQFNECNIYALFTGKESTRNLYLYERLGYRRVREEMVDKQLTLVYLEKVK